MSSCTKVEPQSEEWFRLRSQCALTASELPCLFGFGYESRASLWEVKRGLRKPYEACDFIKQAMARGTALEPQGIGELIGTLGPVPIITAADAGFWTRSLQRDGTVLLGATPDGLLTDPDNNPCAVVEIKSPMNSTDVPIGSDKFWRYVLQVFAQMYCSRMPVGWLCVHHPELRRTIYKVPFHEEFWTNFIEPRVVDWVKRLSKPGPLQRGFRNEINEWLPRLGIEAF
jgi:hypothetical protein